MEIIKTKKHILLPVLALVLLVGGIFVWLNKDNLSSAADARNFDPSNIISDFVMTNKSSMSEAQIQSFLRSKNACNDTNTGKAASYPHLSYNIKNGKFVCLAEESFNGESAANIIWQAGQDYNINPQVLIVLLEKEQGLITDTWPNNIQYRSATGYGCPDTAACETKYYGFKNQVRNAANFFRAYQTGNTGWYKSIWPVRTDSYGKKIVADHYTGAWTPFNYDLQLHPNISCGTVSTYIANRATASLYSYTPYRPNQAALNSQYGTGDGCSSYGNRNFWMFFSDWFGNTQGFTITGSIKVKYDSLNGSETLGLPVYDERSNGKGVWWQCFENGCIIGRGTTGYWESRGSIRAKWANLGYQDGALGLPISGESYDSTTNTWEQIYENGKIVTYSGKTDKYVIKGSIYIAYDTYGKDILDLPTGDENTNNEGVWWQKFDNSSAIIGRSSTGYWESKGSIRAKWAESGYQDGPLGLPIGHEVGTSEGCFYQEYEHGTISGCNGVYSHSLSAKQ